MWDFFKYLLDKISIKEVTMFLIFLLFTYMFIPVEITNVLIDKTPPLFKSWLHLGDILNITISLVLYLICKPLLRAALEYIEYRKQKKLLENLDDEEIKIVYEMMKNHFQKKAFDSTPVIMSLLSKQILVFQEQMIDFYYKLNPAFQDCFLKEFRKSCEKNSP